MNQNTAKVDRLARVIAVLSLVAALGVAFLVWKDTNGTRVTNNAMPSILTRVNAEGDIRVAVVPAPPISSFDPDTKKPAGYAVDVIEAVARNAGLKVKYRPADWSNMSAELAANHADVVVGPVFNTPGRAREFAFTDPLFSYAIVAIVPANDSRIQTRSDLAQPGLRIAVGRGGFDHEFVLRHMPEAKVNVFAPGDVNLPLLEVVVGRADVALADFATAENFAREHPQVKIMFENAPVSLQFAGFMVRNDDWAFREFLNISLRNLDLSGELAAIDKKYASQRTWFARVSARGALER